MVEWCGQVGFFKSHVFYVFSHLLGQARRGHRNRKPVTPQTRTLYTMTRSNPSFGCVFYEYSGLDRHFAKDPLTWIKLLCHRPAARVINLNVSCCILWLSLQQSRICGRQRSHSSSNLRVSSTSYHVVGGFSGAHLPMNARKNYIKILHIRVCG